MKLGELAKIYEFKLQDVELIILEQEYHTNRVRFLPEASDPHNHYHPDQQFNEIIYPYIIVELKDKTIHDIKIGRYWRTIEGCANLETPK